MTHFQTLITAILMGASAMAQAPVPVPVTTLPPFPFTDEIQLPNLQVTIERAQEAANRAMTYIDTAQLFAQVTPRKPVVVATPAPFARYAAPFANDENLYQAGQRSLDSHQWDQALNNFGRVTAGSHADGALYWKAYTLNKLNRRDDAQAAIADLRKSYPSSRWLEDAKALELEIRQASGQSVAPESESDEELKLLALNGLMQSDPDRALPLIENLLKGTQSPKLKKNAVYVLAQSSSPRARTLVEQVARGSNNPDLQLTAISYLSAQRKGQSNSGDLLWEIYNSSTDVNVKRQILNSFSSNNDRDHLLMVAKSEKAADLRLAAIQHLGGSTFSAELLDIARTEKDVAVRRAAIQQLASAAANGDMLATFYSSEQDTAIRQTIIDSLGNRNNAKALVTLARAERDTQMKMRIVQRLSNMKAPEAVDYMAEILGTK